jgi:transposase
MERTDARQLSESAQEALRERAVYAVVELGMTCTKAAAVFGVSRQTMSEWVNRFHQEGEACFTNNKRGARSQELLDDEETELMLLVISEYTPDDVGLPGFLWTRQIVGALAAREFGVQRSPYVWGRWLRSHDFTPQKPARKSIHQDPEEVHTWLNVTYPQIVEDAKAEGIDIHWLDESGLRSDCTSGRSYAPRGQTPAVPVTGNRFRVNYIATLTSLGLLHFMVFGENFNGAVFIRFLEQLLADNKGKKLLVITDRHPSHTSAAVTEWLALHADRIRVEFIPCYSPEMNPVEYLNNDVKGNAKKGYLATNKQELFEQTEVFLGRKSSCPPLVMNYFLAEPVQYAEAA